MWTLSFCLLMHRPLLCMIVNLKEMSEKLLNVLSNQKKFYKYFKNLQIFFLNTAMCSEIVFSLCTKLLYNI